MILTTIESIPGMRVKAHRGLVSGSTVRAKNVVLDFGASMKNFIGGELGSYTNLLAEAREEAIMRMISQANKLKANAIVNVRLATSSITAGAAEVYAYGTAVEVEAIER
ncbi:YbjQ family protein [bacterium]|nr:YbjQ family protein [bacterium]